MLTPSSHSVGLGGLPLSRTDFRDFREHGPRMRIDDLNAPCGAFVARVPTSVFQRGFSRTLTPGIHAVRYSTAPVLATPTVPPTAPAGLGQNIISTAPAQPRAPLLGTAALDINSSASLCSTTRLVWVQTIFHPRSTAQSQFLAAMLGISVLRHLLLSFSQLCEEPRPNAILARLCSRLHHSYLQLIRLARFPSSHRILFRQENAGVAPPTLDPEARSQLWL